MNRDLKTASSTWWIGRIFVWLTVISILAMAGGDLLAAIESADCEEHCEDSCHGCGDCVFCLPLIHMISWSDSPVDQNSLDPIWGVRPDASRIALNPSSDIDHPPQNLL